MEIILHLGAHKTASTFLQKRLSRSQGRLRRHGISFHGPKSIRPRLAKALGDDPSLSKREQYARRRDSLAWLIDDEEEAGTRRLVLSEEQFLGSLRDMVLGDDFYSAAQDHMAPISDALGGRPVHVVASIRGYADFLASVYGQIVRGWRFMPFDGALRGHFLNQHRGWPELVDEIVMRFPTAQSLHIVAVRGFQEDPKRSARGNGGARDAGTAAHGRTPVRRPIANRHRLVACPRRARPPPGSYDGPSRVRSCNKKPGTCAIRSVDGG